MLLGVHLFDDQGFATLPLIAALPLSALVDRGAFFGFNSKRETVRSLYSK